MKRHTNIRWSLFLYDVAILIAVDLLLLVYSGEILTRKELMLQVTVNFCSVFAARFIGKIYSQIWRYGGIQCYMRLLMTDACGFLVGYGVERCFLPIYVLFARQVAIACTNLLGALTIRMIYRYAYKCGSNATRFGRFLLFLLRLFAGNEVVGERSFHANRIRPSSAREEWGSAWRRIC